MPTRGSCIEIHVSYTKNTSPEGLGVTLLGQLDTNPRIGERKWKAVAAGCLGVVGYKRDQHCHQILSVMVTILIPNRLCDQPPHVISSGSPLLYELGQSAKLFFWNFYFFQRFFLRKKKLLLKLCGNIFFIQLNIHIFLFN